ncbi:MAG: energy transducer TonB [Tahibacter sp.]
MSGAQAVRGSLQRVAMWKIDRLAVSCLLLVAAGGAVAQTPPRPVTPKDLAKFWLVANQSIEAMVPNSGLNLQQPSCAAVNYVIESDGSTSHIVLEKVVPPGVLGGVAISVVQGLRYAPGPGNAARQAVATRVVLPFNQPEVKGSSEARSKLKEQRAQIVARCEPSPVRLPVIPAPQS